MRKINKMDVLRFLLVLALVAGIGLAFGSVGRFVPTHKIEAPVFCGSCHPEQVQELAETTHLAKFADYIDRGYVGDSLTTEHLPAAEAITGGCTMCHNFWDNMKWFGVQNFDVRVYDQDVPSILDLEPPTDIYGNAVSPYGLGSTKEYVMNVSYAANDSQGYRMVAVPWTAGLNTFEYTKSGTKFTRIDYVWSKLSSLSPGPVGFLKINSKNLSVGPATCGSGGSAEHGMCHIARDAVSLSLQGKRMVQQDLITGGSTTGATGKFNGRAGPGTFFRHEMAFTTAQYAAKPVKLCGACHVFKLPPMQWGGEPWAISDINFADEDVAGNNTDPFGFRPVYNDNTGLSQNKVDSHHALPSVMFRTPDWAHANVPCIRCHVHAGINGDTVTENPINDPGLGTTDDNLGNPAEGYTGTGS